MEKEAEMKEFMRKEEGKSIGKQAQKDYTDTVKRSLDDFPGILTKMAERSRNNAALDWFDDGPKPSIDIQFFIGAPCIAVKHREESYFLYQPATGTTYRVGRDGVLHPVGFSPPTLWQRFVRWWRNR